MYSEVLWLRLELLKASARIQLLHDTCDFQEAIKDQEAMLLQEEIGLTNSIVCAYFLFKAGLYTAQ